MRVWLPVFLLLNFLALPNNSSAAAPHTTEPLQAECEQCHKELLEKELLKKYIHQPFADKKCLTCHIAAQDSPPAAAQDSPDQAGTRIRWLDLSPSASTEHAFLLPGKPAPGKIWVEAKVPGESPLRQALTIPPAGTLARVETDRTPPRITGIRAEVQQGILLNASIFWQTDEKTNASVQYGIDDAGQTIEEKNHFVADHEITLPGLKSGATYQVAITCRDISGNSTTSPVFTFSTSDISPLPQAPPADHGSGAGKLAMTSSFFSNNEENVLLVLTANQPVTIAIGAAGEAPANRRIFLEKSGQSADMAKEHIPLADKKTSSMTICATCHKGYNQQKSHPVNILPKGKTRIPPEYPTLPDGRISCMSCHSNHAANLEYRLIKSSRKELCLGCHPDKF